jgi:hypothetical protein
MGLNKLPSQSSPYLRVRGLRIATISQQPVAIRGQTYSKILPAGHTQFAITGPHLNSIGKSDQSHAGYTEDDFGFWQTADITINEKLQQYVQQFQFQNSEYLNFTHYLNKPCLRFVKSAQLGDDLIFVQGSRIPLLVRSCPH